MVQSLGAVIVVGLSAHSVNRNGLVKRTLLSSSQKKSLPSVLVIMTSVGFQPILNWG